jgi:hypothetical protein
MSWSLCSAFKIESLRVIHQVLHRKISDLALTSLISRPGWVMARNKMALLGAYTGST